MGTFKYTATGAVAPVSFSITGGALPPGITLGAADGSLTGTPTQVGNYSWTVTVKDGFNRTASKADSTTISTPDAITVYGDAPSGNTASFYTYRYGTTGGVGKLTYSVSAGALPTGVTLNAATGSLSGTPTTTGNFTWTIRATDYAGKFGERQNTATIAAVPLVQFVNFSADYGRSTTTSLNVSVPANAAIGDLLLVFLEARSDMTLPAGWTLEKTTGIFVDPFGNRNIPTASHVISRVAQTAADLQPLVINFAAAASQRQTGMMAAFRSTAPYVIRSASSVVSQADSTGIDVSPISAAAPGVLIGSWCWTNIFNPPRNALYTPSASVVGANTTTTTGTGINVARLSVNVPGAVSMQINGIGGADSSTIGRLAVIVSTQ